MLVLQGKLICVRFPSWSNVFDGNVFLPVGNITCVSFHSPCNFVVRNSHVLVLEGKLTCVIFSSWHNVVYGNVVVQVPNLTCIIFHSPCTVVRNSLVLLRRKAKKPLIV